MKKSKERRKEGSKSSNSVGTVSHLKKTGSREECKRNLKRWEREKRKLLRTPKPPECPLKNFASLSWLPDIALHLFFFCFVLFFLPCRFVLVVAISSQMLLFIQQSLVKMSLFYHNTMFHCRNFAKEIDRNDVCRCWLGMPVKTSVRGTFP